MEIKFEELSKNAIYIAVGAAVVASEKAQVLLEECRVKGQEACERYAVKNEELKKSATDAFKKAVNVTVFSDEKDDADGIVSKMDKLSKEELEKVREKLSELTKEERATDGE